MPSVACSEGKNGKQESLEPPQPTLKPEEGGTKKLPSARKLPFLDGRDEGGMRTWHDARP